MGGYKEHTLTTFIRTKTLFQRRLKDLKTYDTVKVYVYELDKLECNNPRLLDNLKRNGEIYFDKKGNFKALRNGPIQPELIKKTRRKDKVIVPLTPLTLWMRDQLMHVELPGVKRSDMPVYFRTFLALRKKHISDFFSVDAFCGRVHTPVVNLKGSLRFQLKFYGKKIVSLDVKQMQPTVLAKVLFDSIGSNSFSDAVFTGKDVYVLLQEVARLPTRDDAKKYLFQLIFGKPKNDIGKMFEGDQHKWVDWINSYKSNTEPRNPHKEKTHTNLAWLLQYSEVQVMTPIWQRLKDKEVPFLTVHDELLCTKNDKNTVYKIMEEELKKHFNYFEINVDAK